MLCPFLFLSPFIFVSIHPSVTVSPPVLQFPSVCLPQSPGGKCFRAARHALSASCSWFSTADSSTGLISPGRVQRQLVAPERGLSVGRIMLTSPCPLCNHCESIVAQEISGWVSNLFFCLVFFLAMQPSAYFSLREIPLFLIKERPSIKYKWPQHFFSVYCN